ncbi:MAG: hypothetical protein HQ528_01130 [Candidatus Marinimicrobia bacterium]|nr:hypothetical protein [Candidatus Neomarinimicrobiota bacterium]
MKNIALILYRFSVIFCLQEFMLLATDWETTSAGKLAIFSMEHAPYPDTSRVDGYTRKDEFYPAAIHYNDQSVAIFVPAGFRPEKSVDLLFYFHGHNNNIRKSLDKFSLREMVFASGKNLILVFPQGPKDARDSGYGKLESIGGFKRLAVEVLDTLKMERVIEHQNLGSVILAGHSGTYRVIGQILKQGGMTDKIREVYLLDATYAQLDIFEDWITSDGKKIFRSIFTDHLAPENVTLMKNLSRQNLPFKLLAEEAVVAGDLENRILFLHAADLSHAETVNWLERFLRNSLVPDK